MFQLVWNEGDPSSENRPEKLIKANYATKAQAIAQAEVDIEVGKNVIGVVDSNGKFVWTSPDHEDKKDKKVIKATADSYPWRLSD